MDHTHCSPDTPPSNAGSRPSKPAPVVTSRAHPRRSRGATLGPPQPKGISATQNNQRQKPLNVGESGANRHQATTPGQHSHSRAQRVATECMTSGLSGSTVRQCHRLLSLLLALGVRDGRLARNAADRVPLPRAGVVEHRYLTRSQVDERASQAGHYRPAFCSSYTRACATARWRLCGSAGSLRPQTWQRGTCRGAHDGRRSDCCGRCAD